jgi:CRISPR system Cascade subunit CasA
MSDFRFNLLSDPLITVRQEGRDEVLDLTLPEVLASLGTDASIISFEHLQAHQAQAWYCFLCQLAAMALHRSGLKRLTDAEGRWSELLLELSDEHVEAWCLVVDDLSEPAFFQPPVPEGEWSVLDKVVDHPDDLDFLVTSMNHDVKITRIAHPRPAHWLFALLSLQTMANFSGRGNYGVARKSSGYSCRPFVGFAPGLGWGERFRRDVPLLLDHHRETAERHGYRRTDGLALTFLRPWDGSDSISLEELDPYFLEVCRRVRLRGEGNGIEARRTSTSTLRVAAKELQGNIGDPWIPVRVSDGTALNVSGSGFHYELVADLLLTGEYSAGVAADARFATPEDRHLILQALSRGQGQTDGLHERIVPVPRSVHRRLRQPEGREELGKRASDRIEFVSTAQKRALRPALCALFQGDPPEIDFRDERARPWIDRLEDRIDRIFFARLWEDVDLSSEEARLKWMEEVLDLAGEILQEAIERSSVPEPRKYRGWAGAERIFRNARNNILGSEDPVTGEKERSA